MNLSFEAGFFSPPDKKASYGNYIVKYVSGPYKVYDKTIIYDNKIMCSEMVENETCL